MIALPETVVLPLKLDQHGAILVSNTRVTLESIIGFYRQGETPEGLHMGFPTVPLADIYAVIAYYLANQDEVEDYLRRRNAEANAQREASEARNPPPTKTELQARLNRKKNGG